MVLQIPENIFIDLDITVMDKLELSSDKLGAA